MPKRIVEVYPKDYPEKCFIFWYNAGQPIINPRFCSTLPKLDDRKKSPTYITVTRWSKDHNWKERAKELDSKALTETNLNLIERKVVMLNDIASAAEQIQKKALDYLLKEGFDSAASAVQAAFKAFDTRLSTAGISEALIRLHQMTNEQIQREMQELAERADDVIDVAEFEKTEDEKETEEVTQNID